MLIQLPLNLTLKYHSSFVKSPKNSFAKKIKLRASADIWSLAWSGSFPVCLSSFVISSFNLHWSQIITNFSSPEYNFFFFCITWLVLALLSRMLPTLLHIQRLLSFRPRSDHSSVMRNSSTLASESHFFFIWAWIVVILTNGIDHFLIILFVHPNCLDYKLLEDKISLFICIFSVFYTV